MTYGAQQRLFPGCLKHGRSAFSCLQREQKIVWIHVHRDVTQISTYFWSWYLLSLDLSASDGGHFQRIPSLTTAWSYSAGSPWLSTATADVYVPEVPQPQSPTAAESATTSEYWHPQTWIHHAGTSAAAAGPSHPSQRLPGRQFKSHLFCPKWSPVLRHI